MRAPDVLHAIGNTPLVALPRVGPDGGARVLVKWEGANPTGSMKDRMALAMIRGAERDGLLKPGQRVVEFTGGSTGSSLALVCAVLGYPLSLVTADCFSAEKIATMRAFGADVEVTRTPEGKVHPGLVDEWRARVADIVKETGAYWTQQVANPHQLEGYAPMADEILADCPEVTDFVMSVGTGGCSMGTGRRLRAQKSDVRVTLVEPAESPYLTKGEGGKHDVEGIAVLSKPPLLDDAVYDTVLAIPEPDGRAMARRLAVEEGLFAGASTGLNVAAAVQVARDLPPEAAVVTVAVDSGLKYLTGSLYALGP